VPIHADAVSGPVRKSWQTVILAPAALLVEVPDRLVDRADRLAERSGFERELLSTFHRIPHFPLTLRRLTEHPGSGDIGLVAMNRAAAVHEDDRAFVDLLRLVRAVRIRARLVEEHEREIRTVAAQRAGSLVHHGRNRLGLHASL